MSEADAKPKSRVWKKWASLILRIVIVCGGLAYVATQLNWNDAIELPADYIVEPGHALDESRLLPVKVIGDDHYQIDLPDHGSLQIDFDQITGEPGAPLYSPGLKTTVAEANVTLLILGLLVIVPLFPIQAIRWFMLLKVFSVQSTYWQVFRLHMAGAFFNTFMPGLTGGDLMKAYYVVKAGQNRTAGVLSIVADRLIGLASLIILGGLIALITVPKMMADNDPRLPDVLLLSQFIWAILVVMMLGAVVYFVGPLRRLTGIGKLMDRFPETSLPGKARVIASDFGSRKGTAALAVLISLPVHTLFILGATIGGQAVGMETGFAVMLTAMPLIILAGALPISFMGLGVMEAVGIELLAGPGMGATPNQVVAMLVLARLYQIAISMIGGIFVARGGMRLHPETDPASAQSK